LEKHLEGLADERFVVHDQYVSLLAGAFVHPCHKSAISVPVLLFFYRLAWASAIAFGYVAVSRFGKTNVPTPAESAARVCLHWMLDVECWMFSPLQFVLPNPQHPPAHRVVASPLYAARPPQGAARHVAAMPLYVVHQPVTGFVCGV
jgi:hypothetical protein